MASLRPVVLLVLLLWTSLSDAAVDKNQLAQFINVLLNLYKPTYRPHGVDPPMFSVAISIPLVNNVHDFSQVILSDPPQNVRSAMDRCQVYTGTRVVAATLLKYPDFIQQCPNERVTWNYITQRCPSVTYWRDLEKCTNNDIKQLKRQVDGLVQHAEYRVLQNIQTLTNRINRGSPALSSSDLLVFYTYKSPCSTRCSSTDSSFNILTTLGTTLPRWKYYAAVFSNIFIPTRGADTPAQQEQNRRTAIMNVGNAIGGVANVYRCTEGATACISCNDGAGVDNNCVL